MNYNVLKLSNGEDILCNVVETQQGQLKIEAPLLMETISKVTQKGVIESLALGRWIQPYSDEDFFYIEKNSVVICNTHFCPIGKLVINSLTVYIGQF